MACDSADISDVVQELSCMDEPDVTIPFELNFWQQLQPSPQQNEQLQEEDRIEAHQHRRGMSAFHSKLLNFAELEHRQKMKNLKLEEELLRKKLESFNKK